MALKQNGKKRVNLFLAFHVTINTEAQTVLTF